MNPRVLIIDDDPGITDLLSAVLRSYDFDVDAANAGEPGIDKIRANSPQIVILDLMMPQMDGWQTCRAIRLFSNVPIMVLSPLDGPSVVAGILDAGADDCLIKPVTTAVLVAHLKRLARRTGSLRPSTLDNPDWLPRIDQLAS
jgi:DNA-binding response OmpR family regulator